MSPPPGQPATKKRKRMHYACVECNRRKHKCDRKIPCAPCVQRGIAESCRPFEDGDEHGDLRTGLVLVEGLLARETPAPELTRFPTLTPAAGPARAPSASATAASTSTNGTNISMEVSQARSAIISVAMPYLSARTTQANLALRQAIADGGTHPDILLSLLSELPPKDDISALLEIFFRNINPVRFPLPQHDIRRAFDDLNSFTWGSAREDGEDGASHIIFLHLLFMIIATTTFCLPLSMSKRIDVKSQAKRYFQFSGRYDPSRTACFDAARIDRRARETFRREVSWPELWARRDHMGGLYRLFNSTMILGIALLLNPAGPNAAELRGYLDDIHAAQTAHDDTSTREVKIIQLFRAKADGALRLRSPVRPGQTESSTPQMTSHPPNMIPPNAPRRQSSSRGFSMDSHHGQVFPPTNGASRRSWSRASVSSVMIPTPTVHIDNPPLLPGAISTSPTTSTAFPNLSFTPPINTFTMSNNRRSSSATLSPTTPREAQSLLPSSPRDGTPPILNAMSLADDTQALFDQASRQYALANPSWDWTSAGSTLGLGGMSDIPGLDAFGFGLGGMGVGYGAALGGSIGPGSVASGNGDDGSMGDGTSRSVVVTQMDSGTVEEMLAPGSEGRVRSGSSAGRGKGRAPEG
ncbi:hypothetical protein BDV93DRAFT_608515 [Ceratobasidium sp. AG-I]|nr:hypothetical protein BDV93DRAFT_608515 [Ceratobasidium sp. AG-I]